MTAPSAVSAGRVPASRAIESANGPMVQKVLHMLVELADDVSVPRNIRRGALGAKDELSKAAVPLDVRIASAVYALDELANDPNLPTHGRTAIWSLISNLESLQ